MSLNFDAQINLDVGPFLASIERAKGAVRGLNGELNAIANRTVDVKVNVSNAAGAANGFNTRQKASEAAVRAMAEEQNMARALAATERNNAKVEWQAEGMRQKAMDSRLKDHETLSSAIDRGIAQENKGRAAASAAIKTQMQEREQMNKVHTQALAMNARYDAARRASNDAVVRGLARERYALYDVAAAYQQVSRIAFGAVAASAGAAIQYERAFANVVRTTEFTSAKVGEAARVMKYELTQIAAEIPVAFTKIADIATIGNQLGIAQGNLTEFTKTVAMFSSTTGMTAEATAMGLGRAVELLSDKTNKVDFNKFASSIAYAGVKAVATEEQIVSVTKEIATTAKMANFSASEVVGLATALSSVGVAPEAARGSIIRTFAAINKAISDGGSSLEAYSKISGMSAEVFSKTWKDNGQIAFDAFLSGLQSMSASGQNLDTVLRNIGFQNVRDIQTVQKLGDNYDVYADAIRNANLAYQEGTFLTDAYGKIQDTVAAKLELITNNFTNLMATMGEGAIGETFKSMLDAVNNALKGLNEFMRSPLAQTVMPWVIAITGLVGAIAALNTVVALAKAAALAYGTAMNVATISTKVLSDGSKVMTTSIKASTVAVTAFKTAARAFIPLALITAGIEAFGALSASMAPLEQKAENVLGGFAGLQDALTKDLQAYNDALEANNGNVEEARKASGIFIDISAAQSDAATEAEKNAAANEKLKTITNLLGDEVDTTSGKIGEMSVMLGANTVEWIKMAIYQSATFQSLAQNSEAMDAIVESGFNVEAALSAMADGNFDSYIDNITISAIGAASGFEQWTYDMYTNGGVMGWIITLIPRLVNEITNLFGLNLFPVASGMEDLKNSLKGAVSEAGLLGPNIGSLGEQLKNLDNPFTEISKDAKNANKSVRTVVDYAADLLGIFKRIDDIEFSRQINVDDIADGWANIKKAAEDAAKAITKASDAKKELESDKTTLEYQLSVAERYGDVKRAEIIRAKLAKNTTSLADATTALEEAQAKKSKSLTADTAAGAANRAGLIGMLGNYQTLIQALAATGMKGTELQGEVAKLKEEFIKQGTELGYNTTELDKYSKQFDQYAKAVADTPRDLTIEFKANKSSEFNALQEFLAKEHKINVKVSSTGSVNLGGAGSFTSGGGGTYTGGSGTTSTPTTAPKVSKPVAMYISPMDPLFGTVAAKRKTDPNYMTIPASEINASRAGRPVPSAAEIQAYHDAIDAVAWENVSWKRKDWFEQMRDGLGHEAELKRQNDAQLKFIAKYGRGYASGGFVSGPGSKTSDSIPAMLSNGEYVINARAAGAYGMDFMNSLNQMKVGMMPARNGGAVGGSAGGQVMYLSPDDRALLRAAIDRPVNLYTESAKIASSANTGNTVLAQRGLN